MNDECKRCSVLAQALEWGNQNSHTAIVADVRTNRMRRAIIRLGARLGALEMTTTPGPLRDALHDIRQALRQEIFHDRENASVVRGASTQVKPQHVG